MVNRKSGKKQSANRRQQKSKQQSLGFGYGGEIVSVGAPSWALPWTTLFLKEMILPSSEASSPLSLFITVTNERRIVEPMRAFMEEEFSVNKQLTILSSPLSATAPLLW